MGNKINEWEDDPMSKGSVTHLIEVLIPNIDDQPLPVEIEDTKPEPELYEPKTKEFMYWNAAAALQRGINFWRAILPPSIKWEQEVGEKLHIKLDEGVDLNAYYDRNALNFFHDRVNGTTVYSGESPDIICHELGHAVLDAIRPQLWNTMSIEVAALHESFGDISSILSALQLKSIREEVISQTNGQYLSSRLSRLAEQLGWAIRLKYGSESADFDCLRNAVNSFFYQKPETLPPTSPASSISSEPHSFSRIFTGAFFEALCNMLLTLNPSPNEGDLLQISQVIGQLLIDGILAAPIVSDYFIQVAAHMIEADSNRNNGKYTESLKTAFVKHGIFSLQAAREVTRLQRSMISSADNQLMELTQAAVAGAEFGLEVETIIVYPPTQPRRFHINAAVVNREEMATPSAIDAARSFVEDLFQQDNVEIQSTHIASFTMRGPISGVPKRKTHKLEQENGNFILRRQLFDCGLRCRCHRSESL
ncbi:hypothetical protein IQ274_07090 [Nostoc sp. LEGE 12447]|uniref:hypothetical protein n=1 Tax=Nostoc sp. LEGE 12447 TaxID=1828640 RepID=UPI001884004D|nr:hypothetical protein [Nostoc sp. LEGE 12447]MBE8997982.1 hypothetical protein [Nostoc sp. LEGE 12447]